ncbi:envelope stress response membrane protein PspC [Pontiellaceae bacterium B12227]|nr:envelope stress response membrane protein PspC [Pontiellaceae bacterium B12227]
MTTDSNKRGGPYKSRSGKVCGVCAGLAEHFGISPFWLRIGVVILFLSTGIWPTLILYFVAAMIMKPKPSQPLKSNDEANFYDAYVKSPNYTIHQIHAKFMNLDRRIQRIEDAVTARGYDWERRFNA